MSDLFACALRVAITVFVVAPLVVWLVRRGAHERREATDSLDCFTVRVPMTFRVVIACCALAFELLMLGVYVWQGVSSGEWDHELVWFGHGMALAGMALWALVSMPRLDVDGEDVTHRSALGVRRSTTFASIGRATVDNQMMRVSLYEGDRRFCTVSLEAMCALNLLARLEEEGIEVSGAVRAPMTKARLCWAAIKPIALAFNGMALVFSLVIAFMAVFTEAGADLLPLIPFLFLLVGVLVPLFMLSMPARGISQIARQERELGFRFDDEMSARGVTGAELEDDDWFVAVCSARVVAFRRDYLKRVTAAESSENGDRCTVTTVDGQKLRVYASASTLDDLRTWFMDGARNKTAVDSAADALDAIER